MTQTTHKQTQNRRHFLKTTGMGVAMAASSYRALAQDSPNEKINVGFIGVGGMGTGRLKEFIGNDDVNPVAICDVDSAHLSRAIAEVEKRREVTPKGYSDFRKLIERNDLDVVVVTTPDHWHALPAVMAMESGKDVFVEKPLSYSIAEGRAMVEAAKKNKRVTQMGNHIHNSGGNYRRAVEMVQSGALGKINRVQCWKSSSITKMGYPANSQPPKNLDYNTWQGPRPQTPYNKNRSHFTFRYFWDYSGGHFMDFWCHITDVAYWALDLTAPLSVSATGGRFFVDDNSQTPDCFDALYRYDDLILSWTVTPNGHPGYEHMGGIGCIFQGTEANLVVNYGSQEVWVDGKKVDDFPRPEQSIPDSPGHIREFLNAVKSREVTTCNFEYAHKLTKGGHLGNIAYRIGDQVNWDDVQERAINNDQANRLAYPQYRRPWSLSNL